MAVEGLGTLAGNSSDVASFHNEVSRPPGGGVLGQSLVESVGARAGSTSCPSAFDPCGLRLQILALSLTAQVAADTAYSAATGPSQAFTVSPVPVTVPVPAPTPAPPAAITAPSTATTHGYWLVGSDGGIFNFGAAGFYGSTGSLALQRPVVGLSPTTSRTGYWLVASDGGIFAFNTGFYGSLPGLGLNPAGSGLPHSLNAPIVGMVPSVTGHGYFMVASDGGVFAFGDAHFAGSCPGIGGCAGSAVAVVPDASGNGYWVVTNTGSVYGFGDATYYGAPGPQTSPITSAVATPSGHGYYLLDAFGQVFAHGDATPLGGLPAGAAGVMDPAAAIFDPVSGGGYWVVTALGKVYPFGDAPSDGDMSGTHLNGAIIAASGF